MLVTYRARQSELRKDDRALDAAELGASLANAMGHLPWEMQTVDRGELGNCLLYTSDAADE